MSDFETKLTQIASVIGQIDDPKVPKNIRRASKKPPNNGSSTKSRTLMFRIAMTQNKLEELHVDPNIPPEFGTLILMINTEFKMLTETFNHSSSSS